MYHLDNSSGVAARPDIPAVQSAQTRWFTEGGNGVPPSYPGAHWFNIVQAELLGVLTAAGIAPNKAQLNQLAAAINKMIDTKIVAADKAPTNHNHGISQITGLSDALSGLSTKLAQANLKTDNYVNVTQHTNGYGGLSINGQNDYLRFERSGSKLIAYLRDNQSSQNRYLIEFPERSGIVPLAADVNLKADNYVTTTAHADGYGGLTINGANGDDAIRFERSNGRAVVLNRNLRTLTNNYEIAFPQRSGEVALAAEVVAKSAFTQSFATNGWSKLPNGLIVQWGRGYANKVDGDLDITLPIAFPTAALSVSAMHSGLVTDGTKTNVVVTSLTSSKVKFKCGNASDIAIYYFAIGY